MVTQTYMYICQTHFDYCRSVLKPVIMSIGGPISDTCKMPLTLQAGNRTSENKMKLDKMYSIVKKYCRDYSAGTCVFSLIFNSLHYILTSTKKKRFSHI